jgi:tetratricopeptide (TPR) repeat protein
MKVAKKLLDLMLQFRGLEATLNDDPNRMPLALATRFVPAIIGIGAEVQALQRGPGVVGQGLMLPTPPVLTKAMRVPLATLPLAWIGNPGRALVELERAYQIHPDAFLAFARGMLAADAGRWPEAERAFLDAAAGSSLIPVRRIALFAAVRCQWERAESEPMARTELMGRAVKNARKLLELGRLPPWQSAVVASLAIDADEIDLARWVIADWERQAPKDILLWRKRLAVEFKSQAYGPAIAAADKILELKPNDAQAKRLRGVALERLVRQAEELKPIPAIPSK